MNTKSKIQLISESLERKQRFRNLLEKLMDKYHIEDNIFMMVGEQLAEHTDGYFTCENEYPSLYEALDSISEINGVSIRIIDDSRFQVGHVYESFSKCPKDSAFPVLSIETQEYIED